MIRLRISHHTKLKCYRLRIYQKKSMTGLKAQLNSVFSLRQEESFSVACAPLSVHITPIVMSAPLTAAKARFPRKCMHLSQRNHLPHSCSSPWTPTVLPFSTTSPRYRHPTPTTPTLKMQDERWLYTPSFRPICLELTASPRRKCNNHRNVWNSLPQDIRQCSTLTSFKANLKTFLFSQYFHSS